MVIILWEESLMCKSPVELDVASSRRLLNICSQLVMVFLATLPTKRFHVKLLDNKTWTACLTWLRSIWLDGYQVVVVILSGLLALEMSQKGR